MQALFYKRLPGLNRGQELELTWQIRPYLV